jgi:hypothetical protein
MRINKITNTIYDDANNQIGVIATRDLYHNGTFIPSGSHIHYPFHGVYWNTVNSEKYYWWNHKKITHVLYLSYSSKLGKVFY